MSNSKTVSAFCTQCRSRCGCIAHVTDGRLTHIEPDSSHPSGQILCPKGRAAPELIYHRDRLTVPLRRRNPKGSKDPGWEEISWTVALDEIARRLAEVRDTHGPEQTAFSVTTPSGTHISDSISWIDRFIYAYGSPNTIYGTEICNWHKDFATRFTYGHDIGTPDFARTDCILLWGHNPTETWLARANEVRKAKRRGAKIIVVDPRPITLARRADCWLRVRPGTDQILALGLAHLLMSQDRFDQTFIAQWSNGPFLVRADTQQLLRASDLDLEASKQVFLALGADSELLAYDSAKGQWQQPSSNPQLRVQTQISTIDGLIPCESAFSLYEKLAADFSPQRVCSITGVEPEALHQAAELISQSQSVAYYAWNGVGQSSTATQTDRAISLLYTLTGSYWKPGGNIPGGAAQFADISARNLHSAESLEKALGHSQRPLGPGRLGWVCARDVYRAIIEGDPYPVRMLVSFGTNLLVSQPDTARARQALEQLEFHVHADFFVNATANDYADIVLPVATSWEREGLRTGFDSNLQGLRRVQLRPAVIEPVGESRSDIDILFELCKRLDLEKDMFGCDINRGYEAILAKTELSVADLRAHPAGIEVNTQVQLIGYAEIAEHEGGSRGPIGFATPSRRVEIYSEQFLDHGQAPLPYVDNNTHNESTPKFPLLLSSAKTVAYCHSQHRNIEALRSLAPDPRLEISSEDASQRDITDGDWVRITTRLGSAVARANITRDLACGVVVGQHGWWIEGPEGSHYDATVPLAANINQVISTTEADPISGSIPLRRTYCDIERI